MSITGRHSWGRVSSLSPLQVTRAGAESGVDVWATAGMPLAVGDRVLLLDMGGALIVLQPLVAADTYNVVPPALPSLSWLPTLDPAVAAVAWDTGNYVPLFTDSGWWSDAATGMAYGVIGSDDDITIYGVGPVAPYNSIEVAVSEDLTQGCRLANFAPGLGSGITAGATYSASVYVAGVPGTAPSWRLGIEWQAADGSVLSTSWGDVVAGVSGGVVWYWGSDPISPSTNYTLTAQPTTTGTAPPGAARCRLVIEGTFNPNSFPSWRASYFQLVSA